MADDPSQKDGPFSDNTGSPRAGLDAETKGFLDVARLEAEGYTDEKLDSRLGQWDAARLDALAHPAQSGAEMDGLRKLVIGCAVLGALALVGLAIWTNIGLSRAQDGQAQLAGQIGDVRDTMQGQIVDANGTPLRVVTGKVCPEQTKWTACKSGCGGYAGRSGTLVVDTGAAGFSATPRYHVTISGSGSWVADGLNAIYEASATGFKLYVRREDGGDVPSNANGRGNWCVDWVGIGQ